MIEYKGIPQPFLNYITVYEDIHGVMLKDMQNPKNEIHKNKRDALIAGASYIHAPVIIAAALCMPISEVKAIKRKNRTKETRIRGSLERFA